MDNDLERKSFYKNQSYNSVDSLDGNCDISELQEKMKNRNECMGIIKSLFFCNK